MQYVLHVSSWPIRSISVTMPLWHFVFLHTHTHTHTHIGLHTKSIAIQTTTKRREKDALCYDVLGVVTPNNNNKTTTTTPTTTTHNHTYTHTHTHARTHARTHAQKRMICRFYLNYCCSPFRLILYRPYFFFLNQIWNGFIFVLLSELFLFVCLYVCFVWTDTDEASDQYLTSRPVQFKVVSWGTVHTTTKGAAYLVVVVFRKVASRLKKQNGS